MPAEELIIADSSPLIGLARIGQLGLLPKLAKRIVVPAAVHAEVTAARARICPRSLSPQSKRLGISQRGAPQTKPDLQPHGSPQCPPLFSPAPRSTESSSGKARRALRSETET